MSSVRVAVVILTVTTLTACPDEALITAGAERAHVTKISTVDLEKEDVVVIGRLGIPLTTMATLRGTWHHPDERIAVRDDRLWFHVTHVDGEKLERPVEFHRALVHFANLSGGSDDEEPSDGDSWEVRAYESGGFRTIPSGYYREISLPVPPTAVWQKRFVTAIDGVVKKWEKR
jgi:hypothetical protein